MKKFPNCKTMWGKNPHQVQRAKLAHLWKPNEPLVLIDLEWEFFIVKFNLEESMNKILTEEPWFVSRHFLSVHRWKPNFVPAKSKPAITAVWIKLPQLLTEFYDKAILE